MRRRIMKMNTRTTCLSLRLSRWRPFARALDDSKGEKEAKLLWDGEKEGEKEAWTGSSA
jgi:hypothetical protein